MDELPNELICMIFSHLKQEDLFDFCRLVCKRWLDLVNSMKFKELILMDFNRDYYEDFIDWVHNNELVNPNNLMWIDSSSNYLKIKIEDNNFSHLKRLKISGTWIIMDIEMVNKFIRLEHLEISGCGFKPKISSLCLPNLRVLYLNSYGYELVIDAAKLEVLRCDDLSGIKLLHPNSIQFLNLNYLRHQIENLNILSNLEVFRIRVFDDTSTYSIRLSKLPNGLKALHFDYTAGWHAARLKNYFESLLMDKIEQRRSNLKIYINGIELSVNKPLDEYRFDLFRQYRVNYEQLTSLPNVTHIKYAELMRAFNAIIPDDFFSKFNNIRTVHNIRTVYVRREANQDHLIGFLKNCQNLRSLHLTNPSSSSLNQQFYNELPNIANSLFDLGLHLSYQTDLGVDFDFISEFKMLAFLVVDQNIPAQLAKNLIKNAKFLKSFTFKNKNRDVVSKILRINKYRIQIGDEKEIDLNLNSDDELDKLFDDQNYLV